MTLPLESSYRGRRVLVTGHTGFKGSWLVAMLRALGARVSGYALAPEAGAPSLFVDAGLARGIDSVTGDVRDAAALRAAVARAQPEVVLHLAAQPLVRAGYLDPVSTYAVNVMGTVHLLEAVRHTPSVRSVVVVTSDKCYDPDPLSLGFREGDRLGGHCPYSSSKACAELVSAAYRASYFDGGRAGVGLATARAGNVIGGGDWAADRLVPDLVRAATEGRPLLLRRPDAVRPWQHVLEPLRGYLMLAAGLAEGREALAGAWNFGPHPEDAVPVLHLAERVAELWGDGAPEVRLDPDADGVPETHVLRLDHRKARGRLGWTPTLRLERAVRMTVDWYRAHAAGPARAAAVMQEQVEHYLSAPPPAPDRRDRIPLPPRGIYSRAAERDLEAVRSGEPAG